MLGFAARRLVILVPTAWAIATLAFIAIHFIPGDATDFLLQDDRDPVKAAQIRENLGIDRPILVQYFSWFADLLRGDLGTSYLTGRSISSDVMERLPATLELTVGGVVIALLIAVPAGVFSASRRGRWPDAVTRVAAFVGVSVPSFWLALMLVIVFAVTLRWAPSSGYVSFVDDPAENLRRLALPAITLGIAMAGTVTRMLRASMIETLQEEFVRVAHAKGVPNGRVLRRHAFRTALIPSITAVGLQVGYLIGGTVVLEKVFAWPGNGRYLLDAISARDYPVVQAMILVYGVLFILINLVVDLLYGLADPRVRRT
jgi:peptide/nickel transport system permease protein